MESKKSEGNELFKQQEFSNALEKYKDALDLTEDNEDLSKLHSNISATLCKLDNYQLALEHAVISAKLNLDWHKAWYRLSFVLHKLNKIEDAKITIERALECCDNECEEYILDLKKNIFQNTEEKEEYKVIEENKNTNPLMANMMNNNMNPLMQKMFNNEKIREKLSDPSFKEKMLKNKSNPLAMMNDPEIFNLMNEVMGFK